MPAAQTERDRRLQRAMTPRSLSPDSPRLISYDTLHNLDKAKAAEQRKQQQVAALRRALQLERLETERELLHHRRWEASNAYRAEMDKDKIKPIKGDRSATDEEVMNMSLRLNRKMGQIEPDPLKRSWYRLFQHMDEDGSGKITYRELAKMVRGELELNKKELKEAELRAVWQALDDDKSGFLTAGEFGKFMRKGEVELLRQKPQATWKEKLLAARREETAAAEAERNRFKLEMAGIMPAGEAQVQAMSLRLNRKMAQIEPDPLKRSWYRLFQYMDGDGSGKVTYHELAKMVRGELEMSKAELSEAELRAVWQALDDDKSGFLTAGEFGRFMRIGQVELQRQAPMAGWKERRTARNLLAGQEVTAELNKEKRHTAGVRAAGEGEMVDLATRLNRKMGVVLRPGSGWYQLFRFMDDDKTGNVTYPEFAEMIRAHLQLSREEYSDASLKSVWAGLDSDGSGYVTAGEFGRFMRKGEERPGSGRDSARGQSGRLPLAGRPASARPVMGKGAGKDKDAEEAAAGGQQGKPPAEPKLSEADIELQRQQVQRMSLRLNRRMAQLEPDPLKRSWYRLFKHMDDDDSGKITYQELAEMVRGELELDKKELPEAELRAVWQSLDDDKSGFLTAGEFGKFMRKGEAELLQQRPQLGWKERRTARNLLAGQEVLSARLGNQMRAELAGVPTAPEPMVRDLALRLNAKMAALFPVGGATWYRLFRHMDDDNSGKISCYELSKLVRGGLMLSEEEYPEEYIKSVWKALDPNFSGYIGSGEFGRFMKRGEPPSQQQPIVERRRQLSARLRASFEEDRVKEAREQLRHSQRTSRQHENELDRLAREIASVRKTRPQSAREPTSEAPGSALPKVGRT